MNQAAPKSIHLPRATDAPAIKDFKTLSETAKENCGSRVELTWSMPRSTKVFRLSIRQDQSEGEEAAAPLWILREIDGPEAHEIWRAETSDINVVRDACYKHSGPPAGAKPVQAGKSGGSAAGKAKQSKPPVSKAPVETPKDTTKSVKGPAATEKDTNEAAKAAVGTTKDPVGTTKDPVGTEAVPAASAKDAKGIDAVETAKEHAKPDSTQTNSPSTEEETAKAPAKTVEVPLPTAESASEIAESTPASSAVSSKQMDSADDDLVEEEDPPEVPIKESARTGPKGETVETLTDTLHELMELEVEFDMNEIDVPPAVANEAAPKIDIPKPELAAVERMRKIIEARQSVAAMREMKADLKLPLISKNPQGLAKPAPQSDPPAQERISVERGTSPAQTAAQEDDGYDDFIDDPTLLDDEGEIFEPFGEDGAGARALDNQLISPKTAFYTAPAFFKYLEHEFYRFETSRTPFSLIIFEMHHEHEISTHASTAAALRVGLVKRKLDILGHFGHDEYAILLPNSLGTTAALIASRVHDALTASPLAEHFDNSSIRFSFGIANLPNNGEDIPSLINAARSAKEHAKKTSGAIVLARSII
jgi:diguanylate cyclase (GGDEF)-like protein